MKRMLIVYFSMSGHTRNLAEELRAATGADIEEIVEVCPRRGVRGMLRALWDASLRRKTPIQGISRDPAAYDVLIVGGPIWAKHLAAPVRTFVERYGHGAKQIALFCTEGGQGAEVAFEDVEQLVGKRAIATLVVDAKHLEPTDHRSQLGRFVASLMRGSDAHGASSGLSGLQAQGLLNLSQL